MGVDSRAEESLELVLSYVLRCLCRSWKGSNDKLDWQRYDRITLIGEHSCFHEMHSYAGIRF